MMDVIKKLLQLFKRKAIRKEADGFFNTQLTAYEKIFMHQLNKYRIPNCPCQREKTLVLSWKLFTKGIWLDASW